MFLDFSNNFVVYRQKYNAALSLPGTRDIEGIKWLQKHCRRWRWCNKLRYRTAGDNRNSKQIYFM